MVKRELAFRALLLLLSSAFFFLACEAVLRLAARSPAKSTAEELAKAAETPPELTENAQLGGIVKASQFPDIVYELKPNLTGKFLQRGLRTNALGMRGPAVALEKPAGICRIAGIGDSVMFGWGVEEDETYLRLIEDRLNSGGRNGKRYETLNFAVPGYNTAIEAAVFERKALQFSPDLLIVHFVKNDFLVPAFMQKPKSIFTLDRSYFVDFIRTRFGAAPAEYTDDLTGGNAALLQQNIEDVAEEYRAMAGGEAFKQAFKRIARLTKPRQIPVVVIAGSTFHGQHRIVRKTSEKLRFGFHDIKPYVDQYIAGHGLAEEKKQNPFLFSVSETDAHPNKLGHRIYAEAVAEILKTVEFCP